MQERNRKLAEDVAEKEQKIVSLTEDIRRRDAVVSNLRTQMESTRAQLNEAEEELAQCSKELMARTVALSDRTREMIALSGQNDNILAELEMLRQDHAEAEALIGHFKEDVRVLATCADQWQEQAHQRAQALAKVRQELEVRGADLQQMRGEMEQRVADVDQLRSWQTWAEAAEIKQLKAELQAVAAERSMLISDLQLRWVATRRAPAQSPPRCCRLSSLSACAAFLAESVSLASCCVCLWRGQGG